MILQTEILNAGHKRDEFSCGQLLLDHYLQKQAGQDVKRKLSACYVLAVPETGQVKGYYTLSSNSIALEDVPLAFQKNLPRSYTSIPTILLGRLAVDLSYHKQGLGEFLLMDALRRSDEASKSIGAVAVIVDPLDGSATRFYERYGFILLPAKGKMFLPMKTISVLIG